MSTRFRDFDPTTPVTATWLNEIDDLKVGLPLPSGAALFGFLQAGTGATARTGQSKLRDSVNIKDFGAVCNGVTDDSAAVQLCVNHCLTFDPPAVMEVPGPTKLGSSINIDRTVDGAACNAFFYIEGRGTGASFLVTAGLTMFSSTLSAGNNPASQMVFFQNITFRASTPSLPAYAVDGNKFLRMMFSGCVFHRIKAAVSTWYLQTWYFQQCRAYGYLGTFLSSTGGAYDVKLNQCWAEAGGEFLYLVCNDAFSPDPVLGCSVTNCLLQSLTGDVITADRCQGLNISSNYFEGNGGVEMKFDTARNAANLTPNGAITITANMISPTVANYGNPAYYPIRWGRSVNGFATGNYLVNGSNLHLFVATSHVTLIGDVGGFAGLSTLDFVYAAGGYIQPGTNGERLRSLRGSVSAVGALSTGAGFTVVRNSIGNYTITFLTTFSAAPSITVSAIDSTGVAVSAAVGTTTGTANIVWRNAASALVDTAFHHIIMGPA